MPCSNAFFRFGTDVWDPSHRFETSWLVGPWLLFACRALFSLYAFTTLFFTLGWTCEHDELGGCVAAARSFSYFTVLTYWGLAFYFFVAALHTFTYASTSRPLLDRFPRPLQALHALFYTTIVTLPFLVTVVFWAVIYDGPWFPIPFNAWRNVSQHDLNALFELVFARTDPPLLIHLLWLIAILLAYLGVAFITLADKGFYVYSFLDREKVGSRGHVAAYVFAIAIAIVVVFFVVYVLIWLRRWVTETKLGLNGKFARPQTYDEHAEMSTMGAKPDASVQA
ncbi:uncharacterized protein DCS_04625 [Drechmeria coniospora]|uniref:FAR-17a/AIG1-like protein n=1 Tax=Drechmeria coniospora TaxID=98403 RepID=A0A151GKI4_DRECN|nr:uncharacterized protein DCS_04625 [Drechmeria coniospora]KYK57614.1 uncharacterized protein DCS_04625 [Drechmeria coniospora]